MLLPGVGVLAEVPLVGFWGEGPPASVDGPRLVVLVRTISAASSPQHFGFHRGIRWLNAVNDRVAGGSWSCPGAPCDSLHLLDVLLNPDGGVTPERGVADNAPYSDVVFGLVKTLGYTFSPRFRDTDDQQDRPTGLLRLLMV